MPLVYIAAPIDRNNEEDNAITHLIDALRDAWWFTTDNRRNSLVTFAPMLGFSVSGAMGKEEALAIVAINNKAINEADLVLVRYMPGVESWGVPQELARGSLQGKPVIVWSTVEPIQEKAPPHVEMKGLPANLMAYSSDGLLYLGITEAAEAAVLALEEQYAGSSVEKS